MMSSLLLCIPVDSASETQDDVIPTVCECNFKTKFHIYSFELHQYIRLLEIVRTFMESYSTFYILSAARFTMMTFSRLLFVYQLIETLIYDDLKAINSFNMMQNARGRLGGVNFIGNVC